MHIAQLIQNPLYNSLCLNFLLMFSRMYNAIIWFHLEVGQNFVILLCFN